jgi:chromosomal replication initiator protein
VPDPVVEMATARREQPHQPELTFDSFVTGKANQLARAAAIQVANNPGVSTTRCFCTAASDSVKRT